MRQPMAAFAVAAQAYRNPVDDGHIFGRRNCTFGRRRDYFDDHHLVDWTFEGDVQHKSMAVLMPNNEDGAKWRVTGKPHRAYRDITCHVDEHVQTSEWGWVPFNTRGGNRHHTKPYRRSNISRQSSA